jgi:GDP-L-fucose synthase
MSILVTGGTGLVGSEFKGDEYIKVSSTRADLRNMEEVRHLFKTLQPDSVIHCAAKVGGILNNINNKGSFFYDNISMNTNVIHAAYESGVKRLIAFLSTCVFPNNISYPLTENKIHLGPPHSSNDSYAYAKRMADIQIRAYREQYGVNFTSVIPCNIYGPNDNYDLVNGHVIPSLIHRCYLSKKHNTDWVVWGSGQPLREFIFSKDVAKLTEIILNEYFDPEPVILTSAQEVPIKEVVNLIANALRFRGKIIWDESKPDGQLRKPSDNSKIKKIAPAFKYTSLKEGIEETVDHFQENYEKVRKGLTFCKIAV